MPSHHRWLFVAAAVGIVVLASTASVATATTAQEGGGGQLQADSVFVDVTVFPNGTAQWDIEYRYRLSSTNRTRGFERLRAEIKSNRGSYVSDVRADFNRSVTLASDQTGREMSLSDVGVQVTRQSIPRDTGIVTHQFAWEGFVVANETHMRAGDAISGFYVGPDTTLRVSWPATYRLVSVDSAPDKRDENHVTWTGGEFNDDEPRLTLEHAPEQAATPATGNTESSSTDTGSTLPSGADLPLSLVGLAGFVILIGAGAGSIVLHRRGTLPFGSGAESENNDRPPAELLSNEERVMAVLDEYDGRIKQQQLSAECGWGDSKTSKVVSDLREANQIEVFRIGRENVISHPEKDDDVL